MKNKQKFMSCLIMLGVSIPSLGVAHHYKQTNGYHNLVNMSTNLDGRSFQTDPGFQPYCNEYARISVKQAQKRVKQCARAIPLTNAAIKGRWTSNQWGHKGWCLSVSSNASRLELNHRENGLKSCLSYHAPANNNAQIRKDCVNGDKIHKQAARGNINYVKACLNAGVSANVKEGNHWTPLHSAARSGRLVMVKLLLRRGAYINARDINGRTPLAQAIAGNYPGVKNYLKKRGGI